MTLFILFGLMFALLAVGVPVGFAMAVAGIAGLMWEGGVSLVLGVLSTAPLSGVNTYELLTISMFILMAEMIILSRLADDIFHAAAAWVGRIRGGLGMATALAGAGFGAICGTSTASAATLSSTSLPAMIRQGYEPKMASGVVAISGTLAILIPPSLGIIVYGILADVSIGQLLIASIIPGLIVTATIMGTVWILAWRDPNVAPVADRVDWSQKWRLLLKVYPVLVIMMAVTGTIYLGVATPVEASGLGAIGAVVVAIWKGRPSLSAFMHSCQRAATASCMILMIVMGAVIFGYAFILTGFTQDLLAWVGDLPVNRWVILVLILFGYILLGCVMDGLTITVLTVPIVVPLIVSLGFNPVWFGVLKLLTAEVGLITPPIGLNCFIVARYADQPIMDVFRGIVPHFWAHLVAIAILTAFPILSLWLPSHL